GDLRGVRLLHQAARERVIIGAGGRNCNRGGRSDVGWSRCAGADDGGGEREREAGSLADTRGDADLAAESAGDATCHGKAETGAAEPPGGRSVRLAELVEDDVEVGLID